MKADTEHLRQVHEQQLQINMVRATHSEGRRQRLDVKLHNRVTTLDHRHHDKGALLMISSNTIDVAEIGDLTK
jgi:hypothetical protein